LWKGVYFWEGAVPPPASKAPPPKNTYLVVGILMDGILVGAGFGVGG